MTDKKFVSLLDGADVPYQKNIDLSQRSSFRVGGVAKVGVFPRSESEALFVLSTLHDRKMDFHVIGKGSNILFADGEHEAVFVFTEGIKELRADGTKIYVGAGVSLASLATYARDLSLSGLEFAKGIPGSLGGAIYMNAGAYGSQISDVLILSRALDVRSGEIKEITEHSFGYRKSVYMDDSSLVCLGGAFELSLGDKTEIDTRMCEYAQKRRASQPLEFPSAGSYFKRPLGHFAGKLIEDAGLKGYRIGGAAVSKKHAGFIINLGGASASDILRLEEHVRNTVYELYGVILEREVRYIG